MPLLLSFVFACGGGTVPAADTPASTLTEGWAL